MNKVTAIVIVSIVCAVLAFIERMYLIKKGKAPPKRLTSALLNTFAIFPRGIVLELKRALNSDLKPKNRLNALINLFIIAFILTVAIVESVFMLACNPFGGNMSAYCSIGTFAIGIFGALIATHISMYASL